MIGTARDYDYDASGRLTKTTYADGKVVKYFYDASGRQTKVGAGASGTIDPTEFFYNGTTGQMTKVRYTSGANTDDATMQYDANNRLTKMLDWTGVSYGLQYVYDDTGRVVTMKDYLNRSLIYTYDSAGRATSMTDWHGFTTTYSYTVLGQVSTVTAPGSKVWDYDYNAIGQPTKVTAPNTMTTEYSYDGSNRMTKIAYKDGATVVDSFAYGLTPGSGITKITHNDGSYWDYGNDARGRLTTAVRKNSGGTTQTSHAYVYDAGDNMLSKTVDGALTTFGYTATNELTTQTAGGVNTNFTYDDWGQLSGKTQGAYSADYDWRYGHKLSKVASNFPGEGTASYIYRGDGRRHSRTAGGVTTRYNYDMAWNVVSEGDGSNNLQTTFTYDNPTAQVAECLAEIAGSNPSNGTAKYYFRDHLGSTRRIHAADGSTLATTEYRPYGDTYSTSGTQPRFTFTGKPWDASAAMYYFPYRYYSPGMERWISRDPAGMVAGPNLYAYLHSSPLTTVDGFGLWGADVHGQYAFYDDLVPPFPNIHPHFTSRSTLARQMDDAISKCDGRKFGKLMHRIQDTFSHFDNGYRWWTLGHGLVTLLHKLGLPVIDPDDADNPANTDAAFETRQLTAQLEDEWEDSCGGRYIIVTEYIPARHWIRYSWKYTVAATGVTISGGF